MHFVDLVSIIMLLVLLFLYDKIKWQRRDFVILENRIVELKYTQKFTNLKVVSNSV